MKENTLLFYLKHTKDRQEMTKTHRSIRTLNVSDKTYKLRIYGKNYIYATAKSPDLLALTIKREDKGNKIAYVVGRYSHN